MLEEERHALTATDFAAAGVEAPNWAGDPIPSLETWRRWRAAEEQALAHIHAQRRAGEQQQDQPSTETHALHD